MSEHGYPLLLVPETIERCPKTGRSYERGSGALSHQEQSANFIREAAWAADLPKPGERCLQTNREFEVGSGCLPKTIQTERFLAEASPAFNAERQAAFEKLVAIAVAGSA